LRVRALQALIVVPVVVGVCGCGAAAATKQDVIARGDAICESATRAVLAVTPTFLPGGRPTPRYYAQTAPIVEAELQSLLELPQPSQDGAVLRQFRSAVSALAPVYRAILAAADRGDMAAIAALDAHAGRIDSAGPALRYGMRGCARAAGRPVFASSS
jgi:hypothetical protein